MKIGDKVKVIDQTISGEVVRFDGHKIVILDANPDQDLEEGDIGVIIVKSLEKEKK